VQYRGKGHDRIIRQRIAKRQRPVSGQLGDEPVRQRLDGVVLVILRFDRSAADGDDRASDRDLGLLPVSGFTSDRGFHSASLTTGVSSSGRT
jgi:hypothetical protein